MISHGVAFPLLFKLLPLSGNSNTSERIQLMQRYIRLFGVKTIDCLKADREFVGEKWINYLNDNQIRYNIRIRENFLILNTHNGKWVNAGWLLANLAMNTGFITVLFI